MRRAHRIAVWAFLGLVLPLLLASPSLADREFVGKVQKISKKKMIVDNRMGDKVAFESLKDTEVEGQDKKSWKDLKRNDWVSVTWKMSDKPRKAYKVKVLPPKEEAGEDL
jgi:hypothetical protein